MQTDKTATVKLTDLSDALENTAKVIKLSTSDPTRVYWQETEWSTTGDGQMRRPVVWVGYVAGATCAGVEFHWGKGYLGYARGTQARFFKQLNHAQEYAMYGATDIPLGVVEFVDALVKDYPAFYARHEPIAAVWVAGIVSFVGAMMVWYEEVLEERTKMLEESKAQIEAFNAQFSAKARSQKIQRAKTAKPKKAKKTA